MPKQIKLNSEQVELLKFFLEAKKGSAKELARGQAVFMYEKQMDFDLIFILTNIKKSTLFKWRLRFVKNGIEAFKDKEKALRPLLTKGQIEEILNMLKVRSPRDFDYDADFWTTSILGRLIKERYGVQYKTKKRFYLLFKQAKFSFHKPGQQYRNRQQPEIDAWIEKTRPIIAEHLKDPNTVVLTGDEMVLRSATTFQKVWIPLNNFPKIDVSNKRMNRSIYGFLNIKTGVQHAYKTKWQNSTITCKVLEQLCQLYEGKKIILLWDNAPWHRSKEICEWLAKNKPNLFLIAFPRYAPELNPQEHVWKTGRAMITHNKFIEHIDTIADKFIEYLNSNVFKYSLLDLVYV